MSNKQHAIRFTLRRHAFLGLMTFLVGFMALPFNGLVSIPDIAKDYLASLTTPNMAPPYLYGSMDNFLIHRARLLSNSLLTCLLFAAIGFLAAMVLFSHLFSRKKHIMMVSLPVSRTQDFLHRFVSFLVLSLLPTLLNCLCYLAIALVCGLGGHFDMLVLLRYFCSLLLVQLYGFAIGSLACALTGQIWAACIGTVVLGMGVEVTLILWQQLMTRIFYWTMPYEVLMEGIFTCSPACSLYNLIAGQDTSGLPGILMIIVSLGASTFLQHRRPVERTGDTLAFKVSEPILTVLLSIVGGTMFAYIFYTIFFSELAMVIFMVLGVVVTWMLCQVCFSGHLYQICKRPVLAVISAAILLCVTVVMHFDLTGYNAYMPEFSQITAIQFHDANLSSHDVTISDPETLSVAYTWASTLRDRAVQDGCIDTIAVQVTYVTDRGPVIRKYPMNASGSSELAGKIVTSRDFQQFLLHENDMDTMRDLLASDKKLDAMWCDTGIRAPYHAYKPFANDESLDYTSTSNKNDLLAVLAALEHDIPLRTAEDYRRSPVYTLNMYGFNTPENQHAEVRQYVYPCDTETIRAIFGERADEVIMAVNEGMFADDVIFVKYVDGEFTQAVDAAQKQEWYRHSTCDEFFFDAVPDENTSYIITSCEYLGQNRNFDTDTNTENIIETILDIYDSIPGAYRHASLE